MAISFKGSYSTISLGHFIKPIRDAVGDNSFYQSTGFIWLSKSTKWQNDNTGAIVMHTIGTFRELASIGLNATPTFVAVFQRPALIL